MIKKQREERDESREYRMSGQEDLCECQFLKIRKFDRTLEKGKEGVQ